MEQALIRIRGVAYMLTYPDPASLGRHGRAYPHVYGHCTFCGKDKPQRLPT